MMDDQRDYEEERYNADLCPLCDYSPCVGGAGEGSCRGGPWPTEHRQTLTIVGPNLPQQAKATFHVHAEGCSDLRRGWIRHYSGAAWSGTFTSLLDVEAEVYDFAPDENPDYTLGDYLDEFYFAPCVTLPRAGGTDDDGVCASCDGDEGRHLLTCEHAPAPR